MLGVLGVVVLLAVAPIAAQTPASVASYGSSCPFPNFTLGHTGLLKIGTTFQIHTLGCASSSCRGALTMIGFAQANTPFGHAGVTQVCG